MAVKRLITSIFIAFLASVATIGILAYLARPPEKPVAEKTRPVSLAELARHRSAADCWMAIEGNVYDFTSYVATHPTAPEVIIQWCGKEATEAFNTKGYGRPHSAAASAILPRYLVGKLGE